MTIAFIDAHRDRVAGRGDVPGAGVLRAHLSTPPRPGRRSARAISDEAHKIEIRRVWKANYSCYGPRRLHKQLRREGHVDRALHRRSPDGRAWASAACNAASKQFTTIPDDTAARPPDLVNRHFTAERPNELWLADITYCRPGRAGCTSAFILDVYARMIVGWQIANHMRTDLVLDAFEMAAWRRQLTDGALSTTPTPARSTRLPLHRPARRRRTLRLGRVRRRLLRQRDGRSAERDVQSRARHAPRTMANPRRHSRSRSSSGSTGTTPSASTARSATSHPPSTKPTGTVTTQPPQRISPPKPHCTRPGVAHPGALLAWSAIVVWGFTVGTATGWAVVGVATALIAAGQIVKYTIPGRRLRADGVPNRSLVVGGLVAIVGVLRRSGRGSVHRLRPWRLRVGGPAGRCTDGVAVDQGSLARRGCFDTARADLHAVGRGRVDHRGDHHLTRVRPVWRRASGIEATRLMNRG